TAGAFASMLGCSPTPTSTTWGTPSPVNQTETWGGCAMQNVAVALDTIQGAGHGCPNAGGLDGLNGSDCRTEGWNFLTANGGFTAPGGTPDGLYDLRAVATDSAGSTSASPTVTQRLIANVAPVAILADPGATLQGSVTLSAVASARPGRTIEQVAFQR